MKAEERLALARELQPRMVAAMRAIDGNEIVRVLLDRRIERVEFTIGYTYRLGVFGSSPEAPNSEFGKLVGIEPADTAALADLIEIVGTYAGRVHGQIGKPHVFRMLDGSNALVGDADLITWQRA